MSFYELVLHTPLIQNALIAGALTGVCCACLSPLVVLKRMAFIGDGIAHASYGGMGLALFVMSTAGFYSPEVQIATLAFSVALGALIGYMTRRPEGLDKLGEDSVIGIAFSVCMALGALLIKLRHNRSPQTIPSVDVFLFGSMLNIGWTDITLLAVVLAAVLFLLIAFKKELLFYAFDARLAEVSGVRAGPIHYAFIMLLVLTVTVSSRVVGIVLVSATLILPGAVALRVCKRLGPAMAFAALIGFVSFELGVYASYALNVPPGSAIVLIQFIFLPLAPLLKSPEAKEITA
ncbi:MAG: metal ABC transporter permease [Planctomycetota bacterium]